MNNHANRLCQTCGKPLRGRMDKKFCDDSCRNTFNNKAQSEANDFVRQVNLVLKKNRRILADLLGQEKMLKIPLQQLREKGFHFHYQTHCYTTQKGQTYYFCYEYGLLPLEKNTFLLVKKNEVLSTASYAGGEKPYLMQAASEAVGRQ